MERSTIRILNALTSFSLDEFNDRLRLQKLVFLTRKIGFNLGYSFTWYARGPYSPSLTRMLFSANEQNQLILANVKLTATERKIVKRLREFLQDDIDNPGVLELLASVWYSLRRRTYTKKERYDLISNILHRKPQYAREQIEEAYERISRFRNR